MLDWNLFQSDGCHDIWREDPGMNIPERFWKSHAASFVEALARRPRWEICIGSFLLILLVLLVDHGMGRQFSIALFYSIPISIVAWFVGPFSALVLAVVSVILWEATDYALGRVSRPWIPLINGLFRVVFYAFFIMVLVRLRTLQNNLKALAEERATALAQEAARSIRLEREMLEAGEREQRRIGQDLHDGLCQHLTGTALASQVLVENLGGPAQAKARRVVELIEDGIGLARGIAKGLYPLELRSDGLMQALEDFTSNTSDLFGIRCRFVCDNPVLIETPSTAAHLYRIAQEAVSNAIRHGRATEIEVLLEESDSGIRLSVADNGVGVPDPLPDCDGLGLRTMADRAKSIGGQFSIRPGAIGGAEVVCVAPGRWIT
jgi:signal transduction histidine kinase